MPQTATNPKTGERIALVGGQWVPVTKTATNPKTGEQIGLAGNSWVTIKAPPAAAPAEKAKKFAPSPIEEIPVVGSALSGIADIPLGFMTGAATIGKTFSDLAGADNAVSRGIADFGKSAEELQSAEAREDAARDAAEMAKAEGFFESVGAAGKAFLRHPLDVTANLLGTAAPFVAAAASGAGLPALGALGAASGVGMVKGDIYDATLARAKQAGMSDAQAKKIADEAQSYGGKNIDMIALGGVIGGIANATGAGPALGKWLGGTVARDLAEQAAARAAAKAAGQEVTEEAGKGLLRRTAEGAVIEALPEGIQAGQERLAQNLAQERAGFPTDTWKGVLEQAAYEGTLGGIFGGGIDAMAGRRPITDERQARIDEEERRATEFDAASGEVGKAYNDAVARYKSEGMTDREAILKAREDVDTFMAERRKVNEPSTADTTDTGGTEPSVSGDLRVGTPGMAGRAGEAVDGSVGDGGAPAGADIGVEGAQQPPLKKATAEEVTAALPTIEQAFADAAIDFEDDYGVTKLNDVQKRQAAKIILESPEVGAYDAIIDVLDRGMELRGETKKAPAAAPEGAKLSPVEQAAADLIDAVDAGGISFNTPKINAIATGLGLDVNKNSKPEDTIERIRAAVGRFTDTTPMADTTAAATGPTAEEAAKAPVADAIKAATQPDPASVVPGIAETAAKDLGIGTQPVTEEPVAAEPAPTVADTATVDNVAPVVEAAPEPAPEPAPVVEAADTANVEILDQGGNWVTASEGENLSPEDADKLTAKLREQGFKARASLNLEPEPAPVVEAAPEPAPVVEAAPAPVEVAPEEELEEAPEDKEAKLLAEIERAGLGYYDEDTEEQVKPSITNATYNALKFNLKFKRRTLEQIDEDLSEAIGANSYQGSRSGKATIGMGVDTLTGHIKNLTKNWRAKIGIKVIGTIDELPAKLRRAVERDGMEGVPAFVSPDGTIYFIANNIDTLEDANSTVYHEALGHLGLRALFNTRLNDVLSKIYSGNKSLREQADQWLTENPGVYANDSNPTLRALEEVLAEQSENGRIDANIWAKITAIIKEFGRRIGMTMGYSDAEVRTILSMAHDQIINGNHESAIVKGLRYMANGWHGGPYDFDQFSSKKIGTGEGHAAFGWGLYFGSKREVGEHYRNQEAGKRATIDGQSMAKGKGRRLIEEGGNFTPAERRALMFLRGSTLEYALDRLQRRTSKFYSAEENAAAREMADTLVKLRDSGRLQTTAGRLYEVQLAPKDDEWMDWEKPLQEQSEKVQAALASLGIVEEVRGRLNDFVSKTANDLNDLAGKLRERATTLKQAGSDPTKDNEYQSMDWQYDKMYEAYLEAAAELEKPLTGKAIYADLAAKLGSKKEASLALLEAGVRGNRYADGTSRATENPSFNYVVFDDTDVTITNKYMAGSAKKKGETATVARLKRKLEDSHYAAEMSGTAGDMFFQSRGSKRQIDMLDSAWKSMTNKGRRFVLGYLYYSRDVLRAIRKLSPPVARKLGFVDELMHRMNGFRNIGLKALTYNALRYSKFNAKFKEGGKLLSDLINGSTLASVDPRHKSLAAALAADPKLIELVKEGASDTRINNRKAMVEFIYGMYEKLGTTEMGNGEGQRIYEMVMGGFERSFENEYQAIIANLRQSGLPKDRIAQGIKQINEMYEAAKKNAPYAPLFRAGPYWVRVGKGKNRRVFRFDSETLHQQGIKDAIQWLQEEKGDKRTAAEIKADESVFTFGQDIEGLEADFMRSEPSDVLKNVLQEVDKGNLADGAAIKDMIFQLYAASLPKGTLYEKMQHRQGISGFSADTLRSYVDAQMATINRLTHLKYATKIRKTVGEAYGLMAGNPNREQLQPYIDEMAIRVAETFSPDISKLDPLARLANKATFFYLLTSLKSAMVQFLQLPTVALPAYGARYGYAQTAAVAARYIATIGNKFGTSKVDEDGNLVTNWGQPTMGDSKYINENKDPEMKEALMYAWNDARERGILDTTYAGELVDRKSEPSVQYKSRPARMSKWVFDFMAGGIHHAERIAREIAYMSAFELDYNMRRKEGMDHKTAMAVAADAAADLTLETMFDFAESSKPRAMKGPIGRVALQFFSFPIQMASMLTRSFLGTVTLLPNKERKIAAKQFFGILGMTWMFAGATGMPGFSFMMGLMTSLLAAAGLADDDDGEDGNNPLTSRNLDLWFREKFLPEYFGPDSDLANDLGLDKEQAQELTRAVKMGPISAATNLNFGSSVGLDGLFFRDDTPVDTNEEALRSLWYTLSLGAFGSVVRNLVRGGDYMMKGDWQRAAENITPAPVRNALVAKRLASEGYVTPSTQDVVAPVEEYTWGKLVGQGIGFGRTDIADIQKSNLLAKRTVDKIEKERSQYLDKLDKAYRDVTLKRTDMAEGQKNINAVWKDIFKWNDETDFINPIFLDNWEDSIETRAEDRARSMKGLRVPKKYDPYVRGLVSENR